MQVTRKVNTLADEEQQGHTQTAEYFEIHPPLLKSKGHEQVGSTANQEKHNPGLVQTDPDRLRQADGVAHHALDQRLVADEVAAEKRAGKYPVDHRRLPFEEGFTVKREGHPTKHQAGREGQPLAFLQAALNDEQRAVDHDRGGNQHAGSTEDAAEHEALIGKLDGAGVHLVDDEKQNKRNEVDELFHGASHKRDETA